MRRLWILGFLLSIVATANAAELPRFDELLKAAKAQSLEAKRAALQRDQASASEAAVAYDAWPQLGVSAAVGKRRIETDASSSHPDSQTYGAKLSYEIYSFGRTASERDRAAYATKVASLTLEEVHHELAWSVARRYAAAVSSLRLLTIARENLDVSETKLKTTRQDFRRGLRPEIDLVAAEADAGTAKMNFEKMRTDVILAIRELSQLTGETLAPDAVLSAATPAGKSPDEWEKLLTTWKPRPSPAEMRRAMERESIEAEASAVTASTLPSLGLALSAQEERGEGTPTRTYAGQLELSWNLPWPGQFSAHREQIFKKREFLTTEEAIETRNREHAEALGIDRFEAAKRLWTTVETQLQWKERQHRLTHSRYAAGKATVLELSNSELELGNTRLERARIANSLDTAVLDVAQARSLDDPGALFR